MNRRLVLFCAVTFVAVWSSSVKADHGYYGYGFPWFGYGNNGPAAYALGNIPTPPYFALHPPVYYSHPVARPYGKSPFACPCDCHHEKREATRRLYVNPFVETLPQEVPTKSKSNTTKTTSTIAVVPKRIANPYFQGEQPATTKLAATP